MKRIRKRDYEKLQALAFRLSQQFADPARMSAYIWRGDVRAIQWAAWWIRETLIDEENKA